MKRTPLERKSPLRAKAPMNRKREKRTAPKRKVSDTRFRSPAYLAWVRTLPCCVCGAPANAAHHLKGIWHASGAGLKAPDSLVMPICDGPGDTCHRRIHAEKALRDRQPKYLCHTIALGMQEFGGEIHEALREALAFINEKEQAA